MFKQGSLFLVNEIFLQIIEEQMPIIRMNFHFILMWRLQEKLHHGSSRIFNLKASQLTLVL